jgi:hypothetical protein
MGLGFKSFLHNDSHSVFLLSHAFFVFPGCPFLFLDGVDEIVHFESSPLGWAIRMANLPGLEANETVAHNIVAPYHFRVAGESCDGWSRRGLARKGQCI